MPKKEKEFDQFKYQNDYNKKTYDRVQLILPKGEKTIIKEMASSLGLSVNAFICSAIKEKMDSLE